MLAPVRVRVCNSFIVFMVAWRGIQKPTAANGSQQKSVCVCVCARDSLARWRSIRQTSNHHLWKHNSRLHIQIHKLHIMHANEPWVYVSPHTHADCTKLLSVCILGPTCLASGFTYSPIVPNSQRAPHDCLMYPSKISMQQMTMCVFICVLGMFFY